MSLFSPRILLPLVWLLAASCGKPSGESVGSRPAPAVALSILSGSENKDLEPILQRYAAQAGVRVDLKYSGSVDISREIEKGREAEGDAVWPASTLWIDLGDSRKVVRHTTSIYRSPVVFAIKSKLAATLGWKGRDVTVEEVLNAVEKENVRFAMTSATQSNSGAAWYLGCLHAFSGRPDMLQSEHLQNADTRDRLRRLLGQVDRSSGSSGWLKDFLLAHYAEFDAMVNYESLVIEANRALEAEGRDPLYLVYPVDGLSLADAGLGYLDKGDPARERAFLALRDHLMSAPVQEEIRRTGRRTGLLGLEAAPGDETVFRREWGCDLSRILTPVRTPAAAVLREALNLYQTALRKPSLTAYVLDFSGSMKGNGDTQLKRAMALLLDPEESARLLLQPSADDVAVVVPFNQAPMPAWTFSGNDPEILRQALRRIQALQPGGGTDMYAGALAALRQLAELEKTGKYQPAIILMSDGESQGSLDEFRRAVAAEKLSLDVPLFTILFGETTEAQMRPLAEARAGKMFDGRKDVARAFREAKGYN